MIGNSEILNRFDVLYNNITSSQAPGLDAYEKSVFWNKATLEVLKNHLNPKGNKYGEGFDFSSKRQIEFSELTVSKEINLYPKKNTDGFGSTGEILTTINIKEDDQHNKYAERNHVSLDFSDIMAILNETLEVCSEDQLTMYLSQIDLWCFGIAIANDFNGDGNVDISDATDLINYLMQENWIDEEDRSAAAGALINELLYNEPQKIILKHPRTLEEIRQVFDVKGRWLTVVPITSVEYDTLMSRPYKYPPRSQAWRMFVNGNIIVHVGPGDIPVMYKIRYVKEPKWIDLSNNNDTPEIPESLYDEVLQRAVELAKAAYVGDMNQQQIIQSLGERSE